MTTSAPILTITQLTQAIKIQLESTFPNVWVQGEISNCNLHSSGHLYFSLKDQGAQITAVMWKQDVLSLNMTPKNGMQVIASGSVNVYPSRGNYQIVLSEMRPVGLGELLLKLEELKQKIHKLGWFKKEFKKTLPKAPKTIGIVTSPTGAAIQDILHVLARRGAGINILINPVRVQGEGAANEIAAAIDFFNKYQLVDVIIVGRGGGSMEDLFAFNEEIVAESIFKSQIPIIAAVGHETDHCIAEYVADVRAPTPSAAAEIVIADKLEQLKHLNQMDIRLQQLIKNKIYTLQQNLASLKKQPTLSSPYYLLGSWVQRLDDLKERLDFSIEQQLQKRKNLIESTLKRIEALNPSTYIKHAREKLNYLIKSLDNEQNKIILLQKRRLEEVSSYLKLINPKNLLTKGYSILFSEKDNSVITSVQNVDKDQELRIVLSDGELISKVKEILSNGSK